MVRDLLTIFSLAFDFPLASIHNDQNPQIPIQKLKASSHSKLSKSIIPCGNKKLFCDGKWWKLVYLVKGYRYLNQDFYWFRGQKRSLYFLDEIWWFRLWSRAATGRTSCMRHNVRRHPRRRQGALSAARVTWYSMADRQGEYHQPTPMQWYVVDDPCWLLQYSRVHRSWLLP